MASSRYEIVVGSRVKYSVRFLRAIACYTGPMPFARGIVTSVKGTSSYQIADILWDRPCDEVTARVNVANLAHADDPESASY